MKLDLLEQRILEAISEVNEIHIATELKVLFNEYRAEYIKKLKEVKQRCKTKTSKKV